MTETALKAKIAAALKGRGFFFRAGAGPYSRSGVSDILGVYRGYFVALEVKTPEAAKKKNQGASENQLRFIDSVNHGGGCARVVWNVAQVLSLLDELDQQKREA